MTDRQTDRRIKWIDCAKAIAIMAVAVDHCNRLLYTNPFIAQASYFSVSLFILLSGISTRFASERKRRTFIYQFKRIRFLYVQYAVATFILLVFYKHQFDLNTYISHMLNFSIQGPYYFLVFFFQLMIIAPFLLSWCEFCNSRKYRYIFHIITCLLLGYASVLCIRYTYILPVHGGGKYLFGGTYIILFYLGILFADRNMFEMTVKKRVVVSMIGMLFWCIWYKMGACGILPFDAWMQPYFGSGFNPPSIQIIIFAIITLFVAYSVFSLLETIENIYIKKTVDFLCFLGKNTIYIFMYHLLVRDVAVKYFSALSTNKWMMRIFVFSTMVVMPALGIQAVRKLRDYYKNEMAGRR